METGGGRAGEQQPEVKLHRCSWKGSGEGCRNLRFLENNQGQVEMANKSREFKL